MSNSIALALLAVAASAFMVAADDMPSFKITTKREDDRVEVNVEKNQTIVSIHSPFGISHAVVERAEERWPDTVVLRLHLKGLENFKVTNEKLTLEGSASFQDGKPLVRLWKDGQEDAPLGADSPDWFEVLIRGDDGQPVKELPLLDGCFELRLPRTFFEDNPKTIKVNWIDFYRN